MTFGEIPRIPPMSYYRYTGIQDGRKVTGKIQAATVDEASQRLKRMGISVEKFNDDAEIAPVINTGKTPAAGAEEWQSYLPEHAKNQNLNQPKSMPVPAAAAVPVKSDPIQAVSVGAPPPSLESQTRVNDTINAMAKASSKEVKGMAGPLRRQTYLFGDADTMNQKVDDLLGRCHGQVISMSMSPDVHGKLRVAMVIEHDVMEAKR